MRKIFTLLVLCIFEVRGGCIFSGTCGDIVQIVNSAPTTGALEKDALAILEKRCPELYDGGMSNSPLLSHKTFTYHEFLSHV